MSSSTAGVTLEQLRRASTAIASRSCRRPGLRTRDGGLDDGQGNSPQVAGSSALPMTCPRDVAAPWVASVGELRRKHRPPSARGSRATRAPTMRLGRNRCQGTDRLVDSRPESDEGGRQMSYESSAEPIKLGYLFDFRLPEGFPQERRDDLVQPFELVFDEGLQQGMIDRPVEIVFREVEGLPKGLGEGGDRRLRRVGRRGLPRRLRPRDHRQRGSDAGSDRATVPGTRDQRHRHGGLARRVDVRVAAGFDDRRAHLLGAPAGQGWSHRGGSPRSSNR